MKYKTKEWKFEAFQYDPYGLKPEWWHDMVRAGKAQEFHPSKEGGKYYAAFSDKRSDHKAFTGDWIVRDEFGRIDVYSYKNFQQRSKLI